MLLKKNIIEKEIHKKQVLHMLLPFPIVFLVFGLIMAFIEEDFIHNYMNILESPAILITDFFKIAGIGASFVNSAIIGFLNLYLIKKYELKINGLVIAAFMTILGFSFFGNNILNIIPIYIGGYLFAKNQGKKVKDIIVLTMFATSLSPIISQLIFSHSIAFPLNVILGVSTGVLIGFVIVPLASQTLKFHDGYSLYNIGFTAGMLGTLIASFLKGFDINIIPVSIIYEEYDLHIKLLILSLFLYLLLLGLYINGNSLREYKNLFVYSGRSVTDFTFLIGYGQTFFNMGLLGIIFTILVILLGGVINGPCLAGIFTVVGFGAFGKHLKNCYPPTLGVILMALVLQLDLSSTGIILVILFSTTIAPISGKFGPFIGIVSGVLHLVLSMNIGFIHGGINLYNNGFAGGITAGILVPIIDSFKKEN